MSDDDEQPTSGQDDGDDGGSESPLDRPTDIVHDIREGDFTPRPQTHDD